MDIKDLSPEQLEKAKACKTVEEIVALAKEEGVELTDEQLEAVSGGETTWDILFDDDCKNYEVCWGLKA